jgi:hypothetical protein
MEYRANGSLWLTQVPNPEPFDTYIACVIMFASLIFLTGLVCLVIAVLCAMRRQFFYLILAVILFPHVGLGFRQEFRTLDEATLQALRARKQAVEDMISEIAKKDPKSADELRHDFDRIEWAVRDLGDMLQQATSQEVALRKQDEAIKANLAKIETVENWMKAGWITAFLATASLVVTTLLGSSDRKLKRLQAAELELRMQKSRRQSKTS